MLADKLLVRFRASENVIDHFISILKATAEWVFFSALNNSRTTLRRSLRDIILSSFSEITLVPD